MILILLPRSVYDTTSNRRLKDSPIEINRRSERRMIRIIKGEFK